MATAVWWQDPPRNVLAGGHMQWKEHDAEIEDYPDYTNKIYYAGFQCVKQWGFPLDLVSDHYECWSYHSFIQFRLPTQASGTLVSADLYLMCGVVDIQLNIAATYQDIDIYYKNVMDYLDFPWDTLSENDYNDGTWTQNPSSIENMMNLYSDYLVYGPHWVDPIDVTSGVALAIGYGWDRTAFFLTPNYRTPFDWNWDERPTPYDQKVLAGFYGATTPYWVSAPTGFPDAACAPCPWLKLTYSGIDIPEQWVPGEDVTTSGQGSDVLCVAADPKAKMAIAGTESGNLWYCWSGGGAWDKIYEVGEAITAVWMDSIRNFQDYPYSEIAWFGTISGHLYKSEDSLGAFTLVPCSGTSGPFPSAIIEIMTSNIDSNRVVVGCSGGIWTSTDAGLTWRKALSAPQSE